MNWGAWNELDDIGDLEQIASIEYSDIPLMEQVESESDSYRKPISIIHLPEQYRFKSMYIGKYGLILYQAMKKKWGLGYPIPFDEIDELGRQVTGLCRRQVACACCKMWSKGLVRKWGEGIYREGFLKRSMNKVGKFYGVRYEVIK